MNVTLLAASNDANLLSDNSCGQDIHPTDTLVCLRHGHRGPTPAILLGSGADGGWHRWIVCTPLPLQSSRSNLGLRRWLEGIWKGSDAHGERTGSVFHVQLWVESFEKTGTMLCGTLE